MAHQKINTPEAYGYFREKLDRIQTSWEILKAKHEKFSSSIILANSFLKSAKDGLNEVTSLAEVQRCHDTVTSHNFAEVIGKFLVIITDLRKIHDELTEYRPNPDIDLGQMCGQLEHEFNDQLKKFGEIAHVGKVPKNLHPEVDKLTEDVAWKKRYGRIFSLIPYMIDAAKKLTNNMKTGWSPSFSKPIKRLEGSLPPPQRHRSPTLEHRVKPKPKRRASLQSSPNSSLRLDGVKAVLEPISPQPDRHDSHISPRSPRLNHSGPESTTSQHRDDRPSSHRPPREESAQDGRVSPALSLSSSTSAYDTGRSQVSFTNCSTVNYNISSSSDTENQVRPLIDRNLLIKEVGDAVAANLRPQIADIVDEKVNAANAKLRQDIQRDFKQHDKRMDGIMLEINRLSEKVEDLETVYKVLRDYKCTKPLDDNLLDVIARNIGPNVYPKLARTLGLKKTDVEWICEKFKDDGKEIVMEILLQWRKTVGMKGACVETIVRALLQIRERQTANQF
ncbi:uncharacterized protein [Ptychodera flava]|uniref:uncharacterized protein n=1 Tax=Ptychodera flava TaxID=63121 RepID=UPI00396A37CD